MILIQDGPKDPFDNMEADQRALENVGSEPILRFYEWSGPSVTYGYFVDPWEFFDPEGVKKMGLSLARRPTGGGIIFHLEDLSFSLVLPATHPFYALNPLQSYQQINTLILKAIQKSVPCVIVEPALCQNTPRGGFCMAHPTRYDILLGNKKVGGSAQRKTKKGLLHQVSLCLQLPDPCLLDAILIDSKPIIEAITQASQGLGLEYKEVIKNQILIMCKGML